MHTTPITDVIVPEERVRKDFDNNRLLELANSIKTLGLLHAPVMRHDANGKPVLIAGERRFRAITQLHADGTPFTYNGAPVPAGHIPYTTPAELPESEILAIELEENIIRADISWQERIDAQRRLHELRTAINPNHTFADTAAIIVGGAPTPTETFNTRLNILVAEHLDDPDIRKAKNEREATQIARKKMESLLLGELATRVNVSVTEHTLLNGSCLDLLPTLPARSVDAIVTDPPYGINAQTFTKQSNAISGEMHAYDDSPETAERIVRAISSAACMKPSSHIWMFCDLRMFPRWNEIFTADGWYVWPHPIIWDKQGVGALLGAANGPRHTYEAILFAQRGTRQITAVFPDVISVRAEVDKVHAAQKPVALIKQLISLSCIAGDTVLDPCCGSGTIFPAANLARVRAIGFEVNAEHFANSQLRIGGTE